MTVEEPSAPGTDDERPPVTTVIARGLRMRCPRCGIGRLFARYLKPVEACDTCHQTLGDIRADDMPAYLTIFIVGHIVVPLAVIAEKTHEPPVWVHLSIWLPMIVVMTLALLPMVKGATIGIMWRLGLRGDERH